MLRALNLSEDVGHELRTTSPYLLKFNVSLLRMFKEDPKLVADRGVQIVRQVCLLLSPIDVYRSLALLLSSPPYYNPTVEGGESDLEFVSRMVAMLSRILLTSCELFHLRQALRQPEANDHVDLFERIYRCWCHQPICLLSLCLLSQSYHAMELVQRMGEIDVTVDLLVEIDRLVQLIESPILAYVRMDLLNAEHQRPLAAVLSALLMLMPQTEAFNTLHKRLQAVPNLSVLSESKKEKEKEKKEKTPSANKIKFKELLGHFDRVTQQRTQALRSNHRRLLESMAASK